MTGGASLTDDTTAPATGESKRYIVGPMIELRLPFGFAGKAMGPLHVQLVGEINATVAKLLAEK